MYESLSPLQGQEDPGLTDENKTGGKDAPAEKPLRKAATDVAIVGTLFAAQVLPKTPPPLAAQVGPALPPANASRADTSQKQSEALASTEDHPDTSSEPLKSSTYLSTYAQSKQETSSRHGTSGSPLRARVEPLASPSTNPRFTDSHSLAIPAALPALAPDPTVSLHGSPPQASVSSRQVTVPVQTQEIGPSSPGGPSTQSTALTPGPSKSSSTPLPDLPVAPAACSTSPLRPR